jgi:hypothetical protein
MLDSIVIERWPKVETDQPKVVPGFANRIVNHHEVPHGARGWLAKSKGLRCMPWYADIEGWSA